MNAQDVMKMIQENEVRFVDLRFTDIRGKEHHVGLPVSALRKSTSSTATPSTAPRWRAGRVSRPRT